MIIVHWTIHGYTGLHRKVLQEGPTLEGPPVDFVALIEGTKSNFVMEKNQDNVKFVRTLFTFSQKKMINPCSHFTPISE